MRPLLPLALLLAALPAVVAAQPVYRCGNSFSQQPCPAGVEVAIAKEQPSRDDAARAVKAAKADAQRADAMERARLAQEAKAPKAIVLQPPQGAASAPQAAKPKGKLEKGRQPPHFTAVSAAPARKRKD